MAQLNPGEERAMQYGCPFCGQQSPKRCMGKAGNLLPRPHRARILEARYLDEQAAQAVPKQRTPLRVGEVTDEAWEKHVNS